MKDGRAALPSGTRLLLGENEYEILETVGSGSNAIVYRARYTDQLQKAYFHLILIKELFPYTTDASIYRDRDTGSLVVEERAKTYYDLHKRSFCAGNEAHLNYLLEFPEAAGGNLNSFENQNTLYSVYSCDGGISLEEYLEDGTEPSLQWMVSVLRNLLDVLNCFHRAGMLHLDISPDNILLLPLLPGKKEEQRRVLLIDYNSVWNREGDSERYCGKKRGYSPPEITLRRLSFISTASDLYSVCAVFFRMLAGHAMTQTEVQDPKIRKRNLRKSPIIEDSISTVQWKLLEILQKGLSLSPGMRFQTGTELKTELTELWDRMAGKGVSKSVLWELSKKHRILYENERKPLNYTALATVRSKEGELLTEEELWSKALRKGRHLLLLGSGGIGKTTLLFSHWKQSTIQYKHRDPVVWYIPLFRYQKERQGKVPFIRSCILADVKANNQIETKEEAVQELDRLMDQKHLLVLLLDGLNEVSGSRKELAGEIHELCGKKGVRIILTERVDTVSQYGLCQFDSWELQTLTEARMREIFGEKEILWPEDGKLKNLLSNQMMLSMYLDIAEARKQQEPGTCTEPSTTLELFAWYYRSMWENTKRTMPGQEEELLCIQYVLEHTLPMVALEWRQKNQRSMSYDQLLSVIEKNYKNLKKKEFLLAFPEYLGKNTRILEEKATVQIWYDFAVNTVLAGNFKLLMKVEDGYTVFHQDFAAYLSAEGEKQKKQLQRQRLKMRGKKRAILLLTALLVLGAAGGTYVRNAYPFFQKDKTAVSDSVTNMASVLSNAFLILKSEQSLLSQISSSVLDGVEGEYELAEKRKTDKMNKLKVYAEVYDEQIRTEFIPLTASLALPLDQEAMAELYMAPQIHYQWMQEHLEHLMCILNPSRKYPREAKEQALEAYQNYQEAYIQWLNCQIACTMANYPGNEILRLYDQLHTSPLFTAIEVNDEIQGKNELEKAESRLKQEEENMNIKGV